MSRYIPGPCYKCGKDTIFIVNTLPAVWVGKVPQLTWGYCCPGCQGK